MNKIDLTKLPSELSQEEIKTIKDFANTHIRQLEFDPTLDAMRLGFWLKFCINSTNDQVDNQKIDCINEFVSFCFDENKKDMVDIRGPHISYKQAYDYCVQHSIEF